MADTQLLYRSPMHRTNRGLAQSYEGRYNDAIGAQNVSRHAEKVRNKQNTEAKRKAATELILRGREVMCEVYAEEEEEERRLVAEYGPRRT